MSYEKLNFKDQYKLAYTKVKNKTKNPVNYFYQIHFIKLMLIIKLNCKCLIENFVNQKF